MCRSSGHEQQIVNKKLRTNKYEPFSFKCFSSYVFTLFVPWPLESLIWHREKITHNLTYYFLFI